MRNLNPNTQANGLQERREAILQALMQKTPQNVGDGIAALGAGIATGFNKSGAKFPAAPTGSKPSLLSGLQNFFTMRKSGGLF